MDTPFSRSIASWQLAKEDKGETNEEGSTTSPEARASDTFSRQSR